MKILKNCSINVMVSDLERAITFYQEVLGLEVKARYGGHYAELQGPGLSLGLHPSEGPIDPGNALSIGFGVTEFATSVKGLEGKGIAVRVTQDGPIRLAHFTDPDSTALFLAELKK